MLRGILIVAGSGVAIAAVFVAYLRFQPAVNPNAREPMTMPTSGEPIIEIGGREAVITVPDRKTGQIAYRLQAKRYAPQGNSLVLVDEPSAEFFLTDGQVIRMRGKSGRLVVRGSDAAPRIQDMQQPVPERGTLKDVHIEVSRTREPFVPYLTADVSNITFDNETYQIYTDQETLPDGSKLGPAQIPVKVAGEYEFDGTGLIVRWSEVDRRLMSLEIAHGRRLLIRDTSRVAMPAQVSAVPAGHDMAWAVAQAGGPVTLPPPVAPANQPGYRATFAGEVRVFQGTTPVVDADVMTADFLLGGDRTRPAGGASAAPAMPVALSGGPLLTSVLVQDTAPARPATRKAAEPVEVRWSGPLVVKLADGAVSRRGAVGFSSTTRPVVARADSTVVNAATIAFDSDTGVAVLRDSEAFPHVTFKTADGSSLRTPWLEYDSKARRAMLRGPSVGVFGVDGPEGRRDSMSARWDTTCRVIFDAADGPADRATPGRGMRVKSAVMSGAVSIDHPQLSLLSDVLALEFEPTATAPRGDAPVDRVGSGARLKTADARGNVRARVSDAENQQQTLNADRLLVATAMTPEGRLYARRIDATTNVVAVDDQGQRLAADALAIELSPAAKGTPAVDSVTASGNVVASGKDGSSVRGSKVVVTIDAAGRRAMRVEGAPAVLGRASEANGDAEVSGNLITADPEAGAANIDGPGTLRATLVDRQRAIPTTRPVQVTWTKSAAVDGRKNRVDLLGGVVMTSVEPDGFISRGTAQSVGIDLADAAPATRPATGPASRPATRRGGALARTDAQFMQNKSVKTIGLKGEVKLLSQLLDNAGNILCRRYLTGEEVVVEPGDSAAGADAARRFFVPGPGRLLYEDFRKENRAPNAAPPAGVPAEAGRGTTAFAWTQRLEYDQTARQAVLRGGVTIRHKPADDANKRFELLADKVVAKFDDARPRAAGQDTASPLPGVSTVLATGRVRFSDGQITIEADEIEHDPRTGVLTARGTEQQRVAVSGPFSGLFGSAQYNTKTGNIVVTDFSGNFVTPSGR